MEGVNTLFAFYHIPLLDLMPLGNLAEFKEILSFNHVAFYEIQKGERSHDLSPI